MDSGREGMTYAELLALPTTVDLETGNRALGIGRTRGYTLARNCQYPCRLIRVGNSYRVVTADLRRVLGVSERAEVAAS